MKEKFNKLDNLLSEAKNALFNPIFGYLIIIHNQKVNGHSYGDIERES